MSRKFARRELDKLYAELPTLDCKGLCAESCGPIAMSPVEEARIVEATGTRPTFDDDLTCSLLKGGRCSVYDVRPTICRLWGMVESMPCAWGCKPSRMLADVEGYAFLARADRIVA